MSLGVQLVWRFTLGIPVACLAWTVTHEELFRELRSSVRPTGTLARRPG